MEEKEAIPRKLNEILIERIRKNQTQDFSQLINSPNDEETSGFFLGGLINFEIGKKENSEYEINNDLDTIKINDIYLEPYNYNDYDDLNEKEDKNQKENIKNNKKNINKSKKNFNSNKKSSKNINYLLDQDFNHYLDLIQKNYKKYENNHFPKAVEKNENKNVLKKTKNKIYETKAGEKIIINNEHYPNSIAYLKNKDLFHDMPERYKKESSKFTIDYSLLEENIQNIFLKSREFINMNSSLSTSMSSVLFYSSYLDKYIKDKLEPFNNTINTSCEKIKRDKEYISEIKTKTMKNSGNIILKRMKMDNTKILISKLKKYKNLKKIMNSLESSFTDEKSSQEIYDMISNCKEEIEKIKNINKNENNCESIIELFEQRLEELKNRNDEDMSGELSEVLNKFFKDYLIVEKVNEREVNLENKNEKFEDYEKYGITKLVLEKISSLSELYTKILLNLNFPSAKEELEKVSKICDYYINGNLMNTIYKQLRGIFTTISEQVSEYIFKIFREILNTKNNNISKKIENKIENNIDEKGKNTNVDGNKKNLEQNNSENNSIKESENNETENTENESNNEKIKSENIEEQPNKEEFSDKDEIFILLCIILSKNKLNEVILFFIDLIIKKVENSDIIEKILRENIIKECKEIKNIIKDKFVNKMKDQIQKCLNKVAINDDIDTYINNYYLVLELIKDEISNYDSINPENKTNTNKLIKIIIKAQKNFIEHWAKLHASKFETDSYKSWETLKEIPNKYQPILNTYFSFDIENNCMKDEKVINKFPLDKINLIQKTLEENTKKQENEEKEEKDDEKNESDIELLKLKDGEKPKLSIKINKTSLDIINFSFDILKMFTLFHKECYGNILGNLAVIINAHLNYQKEKIYEGEHDSEVTESEMSMSYGIFLLIQYIYDHIKESDFFVEIAKNCKQKLIDNYLAISKTINKCFDISKKSIEKLISKKCLGESLSKLKEIELPNYSMVTGEIPVKEYALIFVDQFQNIYESMTNSYEESFIEEITNKTLETFFDNFEDFIFHGQKIEEESCLKQFKKDMIFIKKNLVFITVLDLTDVKERIDNINKIVLPESMLKSKKK